MTAVVVVFGATGLQGGSVLRTLAPHKEYLVRAVSRRPQSEKARELAEQFPQVEWVQADTDDPDSLDEAVAGASAVFGVTQFVDSTAASGVDVQEVEYEEGKRIIDACAKAKVDFVVFSTLPSAAEISNGEFTGIHHFEAKARIQKYLFAGPFKSASAVVQSAVYLQNFLGNARWDDEDDTTVVFGAFDDLDHKIPRVDIEHDMGLVVKHVIDNRQASTGRVFPVVSGYFSPREIAAAFTQATGISAHPIKVSMDFVLDPGLRAMFEFLAKYDMYAGTPKLQISQALATPLTFWKRSGYQGPPKAL
ncbi:hypothetical protein GGF46_001478 [Coemansia sp. RSA 552]|nr:hypothetical protein GGF46_001478 [Coemansia sp. RSA 552]